MRNALQRSGCSARHALGPARDRGDAGAGRLRHVSVLSFAFLTDAATEDATALARDLVSAFVRPLVFDGIPIATRIGVGLTRLDRSFVQPLDVDPRRRKLVRSIIDMSHDLGFRVVAEGVETATAYDMLGIWGCDEGQGYYMSQPIPADAFAAFAKAL